MMFFSNATACFDMWEEGVRSSVVFTWAAIKWMKMTGKSDQSTGNHHYASYVCETGSVAFWFSAPYSKATEKPKDKVPPHPQYDMDFAHNFNIKHGLAARAIGLAVGDASVAYATSVEHGAIGVLEPKELKDVKTGKTMVISEVQYYGDVVLRYVSGDYDGVGLPNYEAMEGPDMSIGIERLDHCVGNVPNLLDVVDYVCKSGLWH